MTYSTPVQPCENNMPHHTLAAVDLGSNSFHLQIVRVVDDQLYPLDSLKETVRLGAGVTPEKQIDSKTADRALSALRIFAERLRGLPKNAVRVVGTNALRVAKNANSFVREAEATLGYPIEIIAGREEARLIYIGVAQTLPPANHNRLVVDIGGGSTEFIIGHRMKPKQLDSLYMGCVSYSERFFPGGKIDKKSFREAQFAAARELESIITPFRKEGWRDAYGSSGTAKALGIILMENGLTKDGISREGLEWLRDKALKAGDFKNLDIPGVKGDRVPVLPGGLAIMYAVFCELGLHHMTVADTALRDGVLYDLRGRTAHTDIRDATVTQFGKRYDADGAQAVRVERLALHFFDAINDKEGDEAYREWRFQAHQSLAWACRLHEIGIAIAQAGFHKHSAYVIAHADMPGFSRREQAALSTLILAQRGKLNKLGADAMSNANFAASAMCLRLAVLLSRSRRSVVAPLFQLSRTGERFTLKIDPAWLAQHDLTQYELAQEATEWATSAYKLQIEGMRLSAD
jgi:exopolyphosphatase / guanosine-5'-triphosphate,3'-diphosphate pyrophosphatase